MPAGVFDRLKPLQRIKHYELIRELGRGGMGQVFLARDLRLGRRVAIKFIDTQDSDVRQRFVAEARATAQCSHENIVVIHDVDVHDDMPYMVLEHLEGQTLGNLIRGIKLPVGRVLQVAIPVAKALVRAHGMDIVHRDLKPDNIFVTSSGQVKVLDFGIAKVLKGEDGVRPAMIPHDSGEISGLTQEGTIVGTPAFMSPEQFGADAVDHRTDIWALGVILYRMLTGKHPLGNTKDLRHLYAKVVDLDDPVKNIREIAELPPALASIIDRCLTKKKADRWSSAAELLQALTTLRPDQAAAKLREGESPFPGLVAFSEEDAGRFFGRGRDTARAVARLREQPMVTIAGPSGVGKSSFVSAGLIPALKAAGEDRIIVRIRPGRRPMEVLANLLIEFGDAKEQEAPERARARLAWEPGHLGAVLRRHARIKRKRIILFVDQFEELYTLVPDRDERAAVTQVLSAIADDQRSPLRVVMSIRSDFLDRVAEDQAFAEQMMRGLLLLSTPDDKGLKEALQQPLSMVGFRFEDDDIVKEMLAALRNSAGALPLLQFVAAKLWDERDEKKRMITRASYEAVGGVAGALAAHADDVLAGLPPQSRVHVQRLFMRLVTSDRTRAVVDLDELTELVSDSSEGRKLIDYLVNGRLLIIHTGSGDRATVEIVHESLIAKWHTLQRWLDESHEDSLLLSQLKAAAQQWHDRGRPEGLLWRGEAIADAKRLLKSPDSRLPEQEQDFLTQAVAMVNRAARRRRRLVVVAMTFLATVAVAAAVAVVIVGQAKQEADKQARAKAKSDAERIEFAQAAERKANQDKKKIREQLELLKEKERQRLDAVEEASQATSAVASTKEELKDANIALRAALAKARDESKLARVQSRKARDESKKAQNAADAERKARAKLKVLLDQERKRRKEAEKRGKDLASKLK
jgi:hypothetical protein